MHRALCIFLAVAASRTVWADTKWSKEIPAPDSGSPLTRERRQFSLGDWIPLTQPCVTCRPLTDPADAGRRHEDIGLTPPRPPTVTRQIHKSTFFPQDESSILSVPPPPVFNRNQLNTANQRFPNFLQTFNSPNSLQFDTQSVFPQAQFLSQPFLGSTSLLGSNYPQVLPLLNNPSALLVHGNLNPTQEVKTQKINHEAKVPNLQENVIIEQNRQQQQQQVKNQQVNTQIAGLQVPLNNAPVDFIPNRQQQSILEGNILTPPPAPNNTFPDVIIPGLDKEEIQLLYVPLETLKQRAQQQQQQQQPQIQQNQAHHQQQNVQLQQQQNFQIQQQHNQVRVQQQQKPNQVHHQLQVQQQNVQQQHHQQRVTPTPQTIKFTQAQQTIRPSEHPTTPQPAGHFITHSATPSPSTVGSTFPQVPVTPSTLFFQHQPFQASQSPLPSPTPETPTFNTFLTPSPETQKFSQFASVTPVENLVTVPEKFQFNQEFLSTPKTIVEQLPVKDALGKDIVFEDIQNINKFKSVSIQQQEEQQKQFLLEQQKEQQKLKLLRQEQEQKLLLEQQKERAHQEKLIREQQERERQQKIQREQERQQKIQQERQEQERKQKLLKEQQERERQQKILLEQQERERQQKILREQQERERQQKLIREQQERERQQKILREQQERERLQKLYREQQERERQQKLIREQQEKERQHKLFLEQQERERQQKILREQQERERQQQLLLEQQEKERQESILREQQERERQEQQLLFEQQERERQEKILLEERRQQELLIKQQQEREQLILQEQQERERQAFLDQQQQYLLQQSQLGQPTPTQFSLQSQGEPTRPPPQFEIQTEIPEELVPHQPPLSVFYGSTKGQPRINDVLKELRGAKTISVLDQYLENVPKVFVGPANLRPPKGYGKFELPYLSNIDLNRVERKVEKLPFFVAPLNFVPPSGYSKIPFPAPHVGSVVVSSDVGLRQSEKATPTTSPFLSTFRSTLAPRLRTTTQSPPTTHIQQILPKQKIKENRLPNALLPEPELINELKTEALITTTITPETTTQSRSRRPYYRTKSRRPTTLSSQVTRAPETQDNTQYQKTETTERKPSLKLGKRRQRVKTTTESTDYDSINSANRQYLVETSPTPNSLFGNEEFGNSFLQQEFGRTEVQGLFEVDTTRKAEQPSTETVVSTDYRVSTQSPSSTVGLDDSGFTVTTQRPVFSTRFDSTQKTPSTVDYDRFGHTDYFVSTQRTPTGVEIENAGFTGFYEQTPRIPVGVESNGDSGYFTKQTATFSSNGGVENNGDSGLYTKQTATFSSSGEGNADGGVFTKQTTTYSSSRGAETNADGGLFNKQTATFSSNGGVETNADSGIYTKTTATFSTGGDNTFYVNGQNIEKDVTGFGKYENIYFQDGGKVINQEQIYEQQPEIQKTERVTEKEEEIKTTAKPTVYETTYATTQPPTEVPKYKFQKYNNVQFAETEKTEELPPTVTQGPRVKTRFRTKSRGQVNFANSQASTQSPYVRKRVVYKTRKEEPAVNGTEEVRTVPKYRGLRKGYQTSTESSTDYEGSRTVYTVKPQRRSSVSAVYRRRKPATQTTSENYPANFESEYSPSGVSNDVFDDQIRESSLSRSQYAENAVTYTATTTTTTTATPPVTTVLFTRRRDEDYVVTRTEEPITENYPANFHVYETEISRSTPTTPSTLGWRVAEDELKKQVQEGKKAFDPSLEKKNARRRIRVRVHKRPHEQIETAESQNFGTVANALIPPTPAKPSAEPDLYRFSKTGFNFDQSDKFAGTKNQAYVRNITSDILESTAAFSAPGVETDTDVKKVTIVSEEKAPVATTTEFVPETTEKVEDEVRSAEVEEDVSTEVTTEPVAVETTTTYLTTVDDTTETEEVPVTTETTTTSTSTTTTTTTTTTQAPTTTTEEEDEASREVQLSTATEISHETEICFRGKCIKTNSATADDDLRKLVQSADKVLIT